MSIVSSSRSSYQHLPNVRLGRKRYATDAQTNAIANVITLLNKAKTAKTEAEYFLRISDAFKAVKQLGKE